MYKAAICYLSCEFSSRIRVKVDIRINKFTRKPRQKKESENDKQALFYLTVKMLRADNVNKTFNCLEQKAISIKYTVRSVNITSDLFSCKKTRLMVRKGEST